jgi:hypothetical protein
MLEKAFLPLCLVKALQRQRELPGELSRVHQFHLGVHTPRHEVPFREERGKARILTKIATTSKVDHLLVISALLFPRRR